MNIKELPKSERPEEKLLLRGAESLSTIELLCLILRSGRGGKSAIRIAEEVISFIYKDENLVIPDPKELMKIEGIGTAKACAISATLELSKRFDFDKNNSKIKITSPKDVWELLRKQIGYEKREKFLEIILDIKCQVESIFTISIGELTRSMVHPREVFMPAIKKSAAGIILAHNHPSGNVMPSKEDLKTTENLLKVSNLVGIPILDHIIISKDSFYSIKEKEDIRGF